MVLDGYSSCICGHIFRPCGGSVVDGGSACTVGSFGVLLRWLHSKSTPPESPDAGVAAEGDEDEDALQRVSDDEEVPHSLVVEECPYATKDPGETHDARYLQKGITYLMLLLSLLYISGCETNDASEMNFITEARKPEETCKTRVLVM